MNKINEQDIIARIQEPCTRRKAFEDIVNMFGQTLYWQIRRIVTYHEDADDVLQNTFIKAWSNLDKFRGDSKISTWLYRIAYNESINFLNSRNQTISLDNEEENFAERLESDTYFDGDDTQKLLQQAILQLPEKQRAVFTLKYYQELKYEEISEITGTSIGALKASYHHAVKKIEDFFNQLE